jgi:hypothetical protein
VLIEHLKPSETVFAHDRANTVGASEIGACARQTWFKKNGLAPEREDGWGFRERGHHVEAWVYARLRAAGVRLQHKQRTLTSGYLSATLDGFWKGLCVDVKSHDPRKREIVEPRHLLQVKVQIGLWNETRRAKAKGGLLLYVNASDYADLREHPVPRDDDAYAAAAERARWIMGEHDPHAIPAEGRIAGGRECEHCPYQTACLGAPIEDKGHLAPEERERLEVLRSCVNIEERNIAAAEAGIARLRETAREILRSADVRRVPGVCSVRRSSRTSLDTDALARDGIDIDKYRKTGKVTETLSWK